MARNTLIFTVLTCTRIFTPVFVGVYKWHAFRVYPDGKITKATEQEGELAGKWLEREKGKR